MKYILISKRYAAAAIQSLDSEKLPEILNQIYSMKKTVKDNPEIRKIFSSAIVQKTKKIEFLNSLTENMENQDFWNHLLTVLIYKNRGNILEVFLNEFEKMLDAVLKQKHVRLLLAHEHDQETLDLIKNEIEKTLNSRVVCDVQIDKSIIGGFIASTEGQIIDASIRSNLNRFAKTISKS